MKNRYLIIFYYTILLNSLNAMPVETKSFKYFSKLNGIIHKGEINRLILPHSVISKINLNNFSDLRLFNKAEQEIPYIIYDNNIEKYNPVYFNFKIISYEKKSNEEIIVLECPESMNRLYSFNMIDLVIDGKDYKKTINVFESNDNKNWKKNFTGHSIYDFSSIISLKKTNLIFESNLTSKYIKMVIKNDIIENADIGELSLTYKDLKLSLNDTKEKSFKIINIKGILEDRTNKETIYDMIKFTNCSLVQDEKRDTWIDMNFLNIPIDHLILNIDKAYFNRNIELWISENGKEKSYIKQKNGLIFRFPSMNDQNIKLDCKLEKVKYAKLKIINEDNLPLKINYIEIKWIRKNLFFIPDEDTDYFLYFNGAAVKSPLYELSNGIKSDNKDIFNLPVITLGNINNNPFYSPQTPEYKRKKFEKMIFTVIILFMVTGIGYWIFSLVNKMKNIK